MTPSQPGPAIVAELRANGQRMRGLLEPVTDFYSPDEVTDDLETRRLERQTRTLLGALWHASVVLVDECFIDLTTLAQDGAVKDKVFFVLDSLPERYAERYDMHFTRSFLLTVAAVTSRAATAWRSPGSVAEKLAVRLLLDGVEVTEDAFDLDLPEDWRDDFEEILLDDLDHKYLYDDGREIPPLEAAVATGVVSLEFDDWFVPFENDSNRIPYVID